MGRLFRRKQLLQLRRAKTSPTPTWASIFSVKKTYYQRDEWQNHTNISANNNKTHFFYLFFLSTSTSRPHEFSTIFSTHIFKNLASQFSELARRVENFKAELNAFMGKLVTTFNSLTQT